MSSADGATAFSLQLSRSADRSAPSAAQGTVVRGPIYVFVTPASGVRRVSFFIDDPSRQRLPVRVDRRASYDLAGSTRNGSARPFDTTTLPDGVHTITVTIRTTGGATRTAAASIQVANEPAAAPLLQSSTTPGPVVPLSAGTGPAGGVPALASSPSPQLSASEPVASPPPPAAPAYAYYYLWWSTKHWHDKLGSSFPYGAKPLPLPAALGPSGCPPTSLYPGNQLTDVPAALFTQDDAAVIERDVRLAASSGLSGFLVNWKGTGLPGQTTQDSTYSRRLASMAAAVRRVQAEGIRFHLWLSLKASASIMTTTAINNDLAYLQRTFANDPAFDRSHGGRILLVWNGSRKYSAATVRSVSARFRPTFFLTGDETAKSWPDGRAASLDGNAYYWSSQDPYRNPASFTQLQTLATMVRNSGRNPDGSTKLWLAPFTPGYNSVLLGGSTCIPRHNGDTMRKLFRGNSATNPDGWTLISWNEVAEGTYIQPLRRYGNHDLAVVKELATGIG